MNKLHQKNKRTKKKEINDSLMSCAMTGNLEEFKDNFSKLVGSFKFDHILEKAIEFNNLNIIEYVINNVDNKTNINELINNMFVKSTIYGEYDIMIFFINKGADVHWQNDSAIRFSAKNGHIEIVEELIKLGANIHADNEFALSMSVYAEHKEVVKLLVQSGADIHLRENDLFEFTARNNDVSIIQILFEKVTKSNRKEISNLILKNEDSSLACIEWIKHHMNMLQLNEKLNNYLTSNINNNVNKVTNKIKI